MREWEDEMVVEKLRLRTHFKSWPLSVSTNLQQQRLRAFQKFSISELLQTIGSGTNFNRITQVICMVF